ncbi:MAG: rhomboid family intramembrane serine protease [Phycisphaeraceae bacterium]
MAWTDRDYYGGGARYGGGMMGRLGSHSLVTWLLGINVAVFVLGIVVTAMAEANYLAIWGNYNPAQGLLGGQLWRWITYQFLHGGFFHLLFNMIGLYFFGPLIEQWLGSRRFLAFYLICGMAGAALFTVFAFLPDVGLNVAPATPMVGASGAIFGIVIGAAVLYPRQRVMLLFPPIPMTLRTLAIAFLGLQMLNLLIGMGNEGGSLAHLGGAGMGVLLIRKPRLLNWADFYTLQGWREGRRRKKRHREQVRQSREEQEVDRILDKVRRRGLHSLTRKEKKTLNRATERKRAG